jgi:hypothetical protein
MDIDQPAGGGITDWVEHDYHPIASHAISFVLLHSDAVGFPALALHPAGKCPAIDPDVAQAIAGVRRSV